MDYPYTNHIYIYICIVITIKYQRVPFFKEHILPIGTQKPVDNSEASHRRWRLLKWWVLVPFFDGKNHRKNKGKPQENGGLTGFKWDFMGFNPLVKIVAKRRNITILDETTNCKWPFSIAILTSSTGTSGDFLKCYEVTSWPARGPAFVVMIFGDSVVWGSQTIRLCRSGEDGLLVF